MFGVFCLVVINFCFVVHCQKYVGTPCTLEPSGASGMCKMLHDCNEALENIKKKVFPQTCSFVGEEPVVCCPRKPGDLSLIKCREYSQYAYEVPSNQEQKPKCDIVSLIVGGEPANRKEFPHMVAIGFKEPSGGLNWLCGGSIISNWFILTAAHCLHHEKYGNAAYVRMGVIQLNGTTNKQDIKISELIAYPEYKYPSHYHDIALLKLETPAQLNPYARPACLYSRNYISARNAMATGWGVTRSDETSSSNQLMKVALQFIDANTCNRTYRNLNRRIKSGILDDIQICAGSDDSLEEQNTCYGDSGGPLQILHIGDDIRCMYDIVAVTSFGLICDSTPGVYVRISGYIKWIEETVWSEVV